MWEQLYKKILSCSSSEYYTVHLCNTEERRKCGSLYSLYICDRDEDNVHVQGDKGPYNKRSIIHYRMSYWKWKVRNNVEELKICPYYNQHLMLFSWLNQSLDSQNLLLAKIVKIKTQPCTSTGLCLSLLA